MIAICISRRNFFACRQGGELFTAAGEEAVASDEESIGTLARKACKDRIDLDACAGVEHINLQPNGAASFLHFPQRGFSGRITDRIDEHGNTNRFRHEFMQESEPLCYRFLVEEIDARRIAARPSEAGDKT
jgi:hypothetical protein